MQRSNIDNRTAVIAWGALMCMLLTGATFPPTVVPTPSPVAVRVTPVPHITLEASAPEDEQAVEGEVTEVRLFFSDAPLMRGASVRVVNSSRKLMRTTPPVADEADPKQLSVQVSPGLPPGDYVVQWRCIADDGHVMRGDFRFEVLGD